MNERLFRSHETQYMRENLGTTTFGHGLEFPVEVGFFPESYIMRSDGHPAYLTAAVTDTSRFIDEYALIDPKIEDSLSSIKYLYWE